MTVTIRLFASYAEALGGSRMEMEFPEGTTVGDVVRSLATLPGASKLPPAPLVAVNCEYATQRTVVSDGDEVAVIPPVAGG